MYWSKKRYVGLRMKWERIDMARWEHTLLWPCAKMKQWIRGVVGRCGAVLLEKPILHLSYVMSRCLIQHPRSCYCLRVVPWCGWDGVLGEGEYRGITSLLRRRSKTPLPKACPILPSLFFLLLFFWNLLRKPTCNGLLRLTCQDATWVWRVGLVLFPMAVVHMTQHEVD